MIDSSITNTNVPTKVTAHKCNITIFVTVNQLQHNNILTNKYDNT